MRVDTAIVLDGGRDEKDGADSFDAAYEKFLGKPAIAYPVDQLLRTSNITRIYVASDRMIKASSALNPLRESHPKTAFLGPLEPLSGSKSVRIVPASSDGMLMKSIMETVYSHITKDHPKLKVFEGDHSKNSDLLRYRAEHRSFMDFPIFFTGNDVINLQSGYVDRMIADFNVDDHDVMIGFTKRKDLEEMLGYHGIPISQFHPTLEKNDFFNGEYSRHNGTFIAKWGKISPPMLEVISYFNTHRYQSKIKNYLGIIRKIGYEFRSERKALIQAITHFAIPFFIAKYMNNLGSRKVAELITPYVSNEMIGKMTNNLIGFRIYIRDKTDTPETVIDIDSPTDKVPIEKLLSAKYIN